MFQSHPLEIRSLYNGLVHEPYPRILRAKNGKNFTLNEIKDPCIVPMPDGTFEIYTTNGCSTDEKWEIGHYKAESLTGPWIEIPHAKVEGLEGWDICAPAVYLRPAANGGIEYHMAIQNLCFHEDGIIAHAVSSDGQHFTVRDDWQIDRHMLRDAGYDVIAVYDPGHSDFEWKGRNYECLTFTGIRRVGCGDLYMTMRESDVPGAPWMPVRRVLRQEDVPFHNHPDKENFEWGLEAANILKIRPNTFMMIGAAFLEGDDTTLGKRQRFFAAFSPSPWGPFEGAQPLFTPTRHAIGQGENGHGDAILLGDSVRFVFQERAGMSKGVSDINPLKYWHPRWGDIAVNDLLKMAQQGVEQKNLEQEQRSRALVF